jgi:F0F1-type ATP synthase epsilon subunit
MNNHYLKLFILKPFVTEEESIEWMEVLSDSGEFLILPNHIPLISSVSDGVSIKYKSSNGKIKSLSTSNCILRLEQSGVLCLLC